MTSRDSIRYALSEDVTFRVCGPQQIEVASRGGRVRGYYSLDLLPVLSFFAEPSSCRVALETFETELSELEFHVFVRKLTDAQILREVDTPPRHDSLPSLLASGLGFDEGAMATIRRNLCDGNVVTIPNAFPAEFAETVYRCLARCNAWQPHEGGSGPFHFKHHNLYNKREFPTELADCAQVFDHPNTIDWIESITGESCRGQVSFGASWYQPGEYSLPHTDASDSRSVAYVWHLTKDWVPEWGGQFVWCPSGTALQPRFNWLSLFRVTSRSLHFVAPTSGRALSQRLAVNGWWSRELPATAAPPFGSAIDAVAKLGDYGDQPRSSECGRFITI